MHMTLRNGPDTDQLIRSAREGDEIARNELLGRYRARLQRMVVMRIDPRMRARMDPSDVVQEAMQDACRRLPDYLDHPHRPFYGWLRQITWDRLVDVHRRHIDAKKRTLRREQPWTPKLSDESVCELATSLVASSVSPSRRMMQAEMHARVRDALRKLEAADREILVLRHLEQLEVHEIADVLGISETNVTTRHLRALQRLRRELGDEFGG
jgi:RNA polymerase sigma-70 factor (ECF subfamily)